LREEELNKNFFKALSRVQEIHANYKLFLRTHHHHTGLELMDMMVVYQVPMDDFMGTSQMSKPG